MLNWNFPIEIKGTLTSKNNMYTNSSKLEGKKWNTKVALYLQEVIILREH